MLRKLAFWWRKLLARRPRRGPEVYRETLIGEPPDRMAAPLWPWDKSWQPAFPDPWRNPFDWTAEGYSEAEAGTEAILGTVGQNGCLPTRGAITGSRCRRCGLARFGEWQDASDDTAEERLIYCRGAGEGI